MPRLGLGDVVDEEAVSDECGDQPADPRVGADRGHQAPLSRPSAGLREFVSLVNRKRHPAGGLGHRLHGFPPSLGDHRIREGAQGRAEGRPQIRWRIDQIAEEPDRPYYESWAVALESLVVSLELATAGTLDDATPAERPSL